MHSLSNKNMQKSFIYLFLGFFIFCTNSQAKSGPYLGTDILFVNSNHKYNNLSDNTDNLNGTTVNDNNLGISISAGYRGETPLGFIIGQEVFFDHLDSYNKDFDYASDQQKQDELKVNYRFGVKAKLGYQFSKTFDIIADIGVTAVDYDNRSPSTKQSHGSTKAALLYGLGIYYKYHPRLTFRAYYDYQSLKTRYIASQTKDDLRLRVARIGLMLNF